MNMRLERRLGLIVLLVIALGLVACEGSPDVPEFPLGEEPEPDMQPGGLTGTGGGSQAGGQENGFSSTTAGAQSATGSESGEAPPEPTMTAEEQAIAQLMGQVGAAGGAAPGSQQGSQSGMPTGAGPTAMTGSTGQQSGASAGSTAGGGDCCSCAITSRQTVNDPRLPCQFDIPGDWQVGVSRDSGLGMLSAMAGRQTCASTICPSGQPSMSVTYGTQADSNAATMQGIWKMGMPEIGTARCGAGEVTFYAPPGSTAEREKLGGVKFYVNIEGKGYGGTAIFSCGEPGGWMRYRDMFIESFGENPESTFPE